jgi:hypothetical protein
MTLSVEVSCHITNGKYCTDETVIKEFTEDCMFFAHKIVTAPICHKVLTATMKVMNFYVEGVINRIFGP